MENEQYYIYGKLNQSEILKEYESKETDTAKTEVDNTNNTIAVNVKAVPGILHIFDTNYPLDTIDYDGSINRDLDLSKYVDEIKLTDMKNYLLSQDFARAELKSESDKKNVLHFYRANGEEITSVELSGFTQVQSDLSEINPANEAFVKNKSTKYLVNDGEDGTSIYATQKWTQDEISKHSIDLDVVKDISLSQNETPDYLAIKKDSVNLNTRLEKSEDVTLPLATNSKSGLMSSTDVNAISDLKGRVENLEGKTTRLLYSENENPTVEQINTFVENAGYTFPFEGIAVVVDKTFHIWHYYENIGWQDDGQDTVSTFTNNIAGIIKGSEIEGRVYAENDGTGSLVGYDNLKNKTDIIKNDGDGNQYLSNDGTYKTIRTNRQFNSAWKIDGTTLQFIQDILADNSATVGMSYLGGVKFTDLPTGTSGIKLSNAECLVEVISSTLGENIKIIHLDLYSSDTPPYHWTTIYHTSLPDPIWSPDVMESEITTINTKVDQNTNNISGLEIDVSNVNTKLNTIQEGAEVNTIDSISLNGSALTPDSNKNVNILESIPVVTGTQEKPINFATDLEVGKWYLLSGYIKYDADSNVYLYSTNSEGVAVYYSVLTTCLFKESSIVQVLMQNFRGAKSSSSDDWYPDKCNTNIIVNSDGVITQIGYIGGIGSLNGSQNIIGRDIGIYAPTTSGVQGQIQQSNGAGKAPTWIDNPAPKTISNTTVSNWIADTTYTDFGYKADISITNLTENDICEVIFNQTDASSGNYAQVNSSSAGTLTIYSKVNTEITIPTIIIIKGGY